MNQRADYADHVQRLFDEFEKARSGKTFDIDYNRLQRYKDYAQFILFKTVNDDRIDLKIDVVNDISSHFGGIITHPDLGPIDSWRNILSNKLAAVFRYEPKDIVDIWTIARNKAFNWMEMIQEAKTKEVAVDPVVICNILKSFPQEMLSTIKWKAPVDFEMVSEELDRIAMDIFEGRGNTPFI